MEQIDLYDENRILLGRQMDRSQATPSGSYRLVVHVALFNPAGELLIQRRSPAKQLCPGLWDLTAAGGVMAGESSRQAAERETAEELGYALNLGGQRAALTVNFDEGFDDFFVAVREVELSALCLQTEEVAEVRWVSLDQAETLLKRGEFIAYPPGFLSLLWGLRKRFHFG